MGNCDTMGFVRYRVIYGSVLVYTRHGYSVGNPNLWYTHAEPYLSDFTQSIHFYSFWIALGSDSSLNILYTIRDHTPHPTIIILSFLIGILLYFIHILP